MLLKRLRSPNSTPDIADKSTKMEDVVDDCIACDWCSDWEHRSCARLIHHYNNIEKDKGILSGLLNSVTLWAAAVATLFSFFHSGETTTANEHQYDDTADGAHITADDLVAPLVVSLQI